ncbi:TerB family tellurite resistance protein [Thioalkalivibrio sp. HK1]|uniref:tellurite resistance TerB family protein n=1 Tax=Thioalkalivibrio sp. HK1 TaxID=1469245 RepID=UPI0004AD7EA7|nr:TerB family tellurite resistance protein [Thioalkalivibrio sp. HK1]
MPGLIRRLGIKALLESLSNPMPGDPAEQEHDYELATAILLIEVMRADRTSHPDERKTVVATLVRAFQLDESEAQALIAKGESRADEVVSLHEFTQAINRRLDAEQKAHIVELLWRVAFADGDLDRYEEHLIRRIADLLHIPHSTYIQKKLSVGEEMAL